MKVPETLDEFKETLQAFRDNDLNGDGTTEDQIPFTFLYNRKENGLYSLLEALDSWIEADRWIKTIILL